MKLVLVQTALAHYRESLFEELSSSDADFLIVSGYSFSNETIKKIEQTNNKINTIWVKNKFLFNNQILWQSNLITLVLQEKPQAIILSGVDFHNPTTLLLFIISKIMGIKTFWWSHCTFGKQGYLGYLLRILFYKLSTGILAYDVKGKERLVTKGIRDSKITVINNCLNQSAYKNITREMPFDNIKVVFSGRLTSLKRVDILIDAAQIIINQGISLTVFIIGEGPEKDNLIKMTNDCKINKNVIFKGELYENELVDLLLQAHIGVIPSNAGLSLLQYMASGLPVITDDGKNDGYEHNPEISFLEKNKTGLLYKKNNPQSLAEKIIEIVPHIPYMSEQSHQIARNKYHPLCVKENIIKAIFKNY